MRPRAALLVLAIALTGCPDKDARPYLGPDTDLLALVPDNAALLLKLDLRALRRSGVLGSGLKRGGRAPEIMRKVDAALLAAGARPERGGGLRFALVLRGRLDQQEVLSALSQRHALRSTRVGQSTFYGSADPTQPRMVFPRGRKGWLVVVSPGWMAPVAGLAAGQGRSALSVGHLMGLHPRARKDTVRHVGWSAAHLSARTATYLSGRVGWPELKGLRRLEGQAMVEPSTVERGQVLELGLSLKLSRAGQAKTLCQRLNGLTVPGLGPAGLDCRSRGRRATLAGRVRGRELGALLSSVSKPLTRGGRGSTLRSHRSPRAAPAAVKKVP